MVGMGQMLGGSPQGVTKACVDSHVSRAEFSRKRRREGLADIGCWVRFAHEAG